MRIVVDFCKEEHKIPVINSIVLLGAKASPLYAKGNEKIIAINEKLVAYAIKNGIDYIDLNPKLTTQKEHTLKVKKSLNCFL